MGCVRKPFSFHFPPSMQTLLKESVYVRNREEEKEIGMEGKKVISLRSYLLLW